MKKIIWIILIILIFVSCIEKNKNIVNNENNISIEDNIESLDINDEQNNNIETENNNRYDKFFDKVISNKKYFYLSGLYSSLIDDWIFSINVYDLSFSTHEHKSRIYNMDIDEIYEEDNAIVVHFREYPLLTSLRRSKDAENIEYNILISKFDNETYKLYIELPEEISYIYGLHDNIFRKDELYEFTPTHMVVGFDNDNKGIGDNIELYEYNIDSDEYSFYDFLTSGTMVELTEIGGNYNEIQFVKIKFEYGGYRYHFGEYWCNSKHLREF
jgi:hypothetical protein